MANSLKTKSLCKLSKGDIEDHFKQLIAITRDSRFICVKCARSATDKHWLCKPKKAS
ncbi:hypothetical protein [Marinobacterium arenosum]|uniref:hypothetical protein n=1 Tax=Marinobacterium arenosum TaxID=2862496 RepID=UPI001C94F56C|nr:hypothetical protein [Marinobacterium arenosum]MBY4676296.1 hypothetical protein [Marinobacterium arenosum]